MYSKFKTRLTEKSFTIIIIIILFFAVIFSVAPLTLRKKRVSQETDLNVTPLQRHHAGPAKWRNRKDYVIRDFD